jgi:hypothetical protein
MKKRTTKPGSPARVPSAPRPRVYLDSTIPSTYFDERASISDIIATTRKWWDEESRFFDVWISPIVGLEIDDGEYPRKPEIQAFCRKLNVLEPNPTIDKIAQTYIENKLMPKKFFGDASHLAYATFYRFDFLATWNCNHLANANKRIHLRVINDRLGFPLPLIVTPMELFREREDL